MVASLSMVKLLFVAVAVGVSSKDEWHDLGITIMEEYANWMNLDEGIMGN